MQFLRIRVLLQVLRVVEAWEKSSPRDSLDVQMQSLKCLVGSNMTWLSSVLPQVTSKDLCVALRDNVVEVWTMRVFEPETLMLLPDTTEYNDRYWTATRCVWLKNSAERHPNKKHMVLDGRLRAHPELEGRRLYSCCLCY